MATKIIPDSFRTLSLDLNEPADYSFFDEKQEIYKKTQNSGPASSKEVIKADEISTKNKNETSQNSETPSNSDTVIQSIILQKNPDMNSEKLHSLPISPAHDQCVESKARSLSRSFSGSYESDFSTVDTNGQEQEDGSASEHVTVVRKVDRPNTDTPVHGSDEESDMTDVSHEIPEPHTNNTPTFPSPTRKKRSQQDTSDAIDVRQLQAHQLTKAMNQINKKLHSMRFRPPWRDPNSNPLPSDRTASFYDLYEEFTRKTKEGYISDNAQWVSQTEIAVCRPYHSALNRYRQQERIQMENYALARRLQNVRPSPGMTRKEQLREYKRYFIPPTFFVPRQPQNIRRPRTATSNYHVDHAGDHDAKGLHYERSNGPNLPTKSNPQRNTRSAGSRSMVSSNDLISFYDAQSSNKSLRSVSKERPKSTRENGNKFILPEMRYTIWSNTGRPGAQGRHESGMRTVENRCTMTSGPNTRRTSAASTRHTDEAVGVRTPSDATSRAKDNDKHQSDITS